LGDGFRLSAGICILILTYLFSVTRHDGDLNSARSLYRRNHPVFPGK
jgi:hypothetical protein